MISRISRNSKRIIAVLSQNRTPSQIAWGISIGLMLGLIPKDNLVALTLLAMIACLRVNQLAACGTAIAIANVSGWFIPLTYSVGSMLLGQSAITASIAYLYQYPLFPWTCLENAQVIGGAMVGLSFLLPTYAVCKWSLSKATKQLENIAMEHVANDAIRYRKSVVDQSRTRQEKPTPSLKVISDATANETIEESLSALSVQSNTTAMSLPQVKVPPYAPSVPFGSSTKSIVPQARHRIESNRKQSTKPTIFTGESVFDGNDTILRETIIEVVRYRHSTNSKHGSNSKAIEQDPTALPQPQELFMPVGNASTMSSNDVAGSPAVSSTPDPERQSIAYDSNHAIGHSVGRDESLKYLLWHINGSRDNVRKSAEKSA